jgi:hypothetical protein
VPMDQRGAVPRYPGCTERPLDESMRVAIPSQTRSSRTALKRRNVFLLSRIYLQNAICGTTCSSRATRNICGVTREVPSVAPHAPAEPHDPCVTSCSAPASEVPSGAQLASPVPRAPSVVSYIALRHRKDQRHSRPLLCHLQLSSMTRCTCSIGAVSGATFSCCAIDASCGIIRCVCI